MNYTSDYTFRIIKLFRSIEKIIFTEFYTNLLVTWKFVQDIYFNNCYYGSLSFSSAFLWTFMCLFCKKKKKKQNKSALIYMVTKQLEN